MSIPLADGPAMFLGGSMMSFALPFGAFIVISTALYFIFRAKHHDIKLKYFTPEPVTSVLTREPGPVPAPAARAAAPGTVPSDTVVAPAVPPEVAKAEAKAEGEAIDAETEGKEGTE